MIPTDPMPGVPFNLTEPCKYEMYARQDAKDESLGQWKLRKLSRVSALWHRSCNGRFNEDTQCVCPGHATDSENS